MNSFKEIYYCDVYDLVDDIIYAEGNFLEDIPSNFGDDLKDMLGDSAMLPRIYKRYCECCPLRFRCNQYTTVSADVDSLSFDNQVEIYHKRAKEQYARDWESYVSDDD